MGFFFGSCPLSTTVSPAAGTPPSLVCAGSVFGETACFATPRRLFDGLGPPDGAGVCLCRRIRTTAVAEERERERESLDALTRMLRLADSNRSSTWDTWRLKPGGRSWIGPLRQPEAECNSAHSASPAEPSVEARAGFGEAALGGCVLVTHGYSGGADGGNVAEQIVLHKANDETPIMEAQWQSLGAMEDWIEPRSGGTLTTLVTPTGSARRALLFGGYGYSGSLNSLAEVELEAPGPGGEPGRWVWRPVATPDGAAEPPKRCAHACAALDDGGLLLFGGYGDAGSLADVWRLSLEEPAAGIAGDSPRASWTRMEPTGDAPAARSGHSYTNPSSYHIPAQLTLLTDLSLPTCN